MPSQALQKTPWHGPMAVTDEGKQRLVVGKPLDTGSSGSKWQQAHCKAARLAMLV